MSCQYKDQCPSYSGWCNGPKQDFSKCVEFLITAYENEKKRMMPNEYQKLAIRTCRPTSRSSGPDIRRASMPSTVCIAEQMIFERSL